MHRPWFGPILLAAGAGLALAAHAAETTEAKPPTPEQLQKWIKDLGDERHETRAAAGKHLEDAGEAAREILETAAMSDSDETRKRAQGLLEVLRSKPYKPFLDAMASGDTDRLAKHYSAEVFVVSGSELLKPEWDVGDADKGRSESQTIERGKLMEGYQAMIQRAGKEKWTALWNSPSRKIAVRILDADDAALQGKKGDAVLTVSRLEEHLDDTLTYVLRDDGKGRFQVVAERTDY